MVTIRIFSIFGQKKRFFISSLAHVTYTCTLFVLNVAICNKFFFVIESILISKLIDNYISNKLLCVEY